MRDMNKRQRMIVGGVWISIVVVVLLGWPVEISFQNEDINTWAGWLLAMSVPLAILWVAFSFERRGTVAAALAVALAGFLLCGAAGVVARMFPSAAWDLVGEASVGGASYRLYRTNCGATCANGLVLTREIDLLLGLRTQQQLWSQYPSDGFAAVRAVGTSEVQVYSSGQVLFRYDGPA
jgi:hypothetical protein